MIKKVISAVTLLVFTLLVTAVAIVEAGVPAKVQESSTTTSLASPNTATSCRRDSHYTEAANLFGQRLYVYTVEVAWCYDGTKAWITDKYSRAQVTYPFISYRGDKLKVIGNKTRYFSIEGSAVFQSSAGIPTKWGTLGLNREARPWVRLTCYRYGNVSKKAAPF